MVDEFVYHANGRYESTDVLDAEVRICSAVRLDFAIPSSLDFLFCLLHRLHWPAAFAVHRGMHKHVVVLSQLLCELALLHTDLSMYHAPSLVAACALCLSLACLRCGIWRDGSPGPASSPELYWTASMVQATGYERHELRLTLKLLQEAHEAAVPEMSGHALPAAAEHWGRYGAIMHKFGAPRFLGVVAVRPFAPHNGGSLYSPLATSLLHA